MVSLSDELEDVDDPDWENLGVPIKPEEYTVLDDLLDQGENDDGFNLLKQEQKVEFRSRRKVMCSFCDKEIKLYWKLNYIVLSCVPA